VTGGSRAFGVGNIPLNPPSKGDLIQSRRDIARTQRVTTNDDMSPVRDICACILKPPLKGYTRVPFLKSSLKEYMRVPLLKSPLKGYTRVPFLKSPLKEYMRVPLLKSPLKEYMRVPLLKSPFEGGFRGMFL